MSKPRLMELRRRQRRKKKLHKLHLQYAAAATDTARKKIAEKVNLISPGLKLS